jgi:hypothetical protein
MMLVYRPEVTSRKNEQGPDVPTVDHIKTVPGTNVEVLNTKAGAVVCRRDDRDLSYTCGMQVIDQGLAWSVKFDWDLVASAEAIKARAESTLLSYRTDWRLRKAQT